MSAAKKSKMSHEAELDAVRQHLLQCPNVPKDSQALQVALDALDQERKRIERDAKLQRKFAASSNTTTTSSSSKTETNKSTAPTSTSDKVHTKEEDDAELMEWQDIASHHEQIAEMPSEGSVLGKMLAQSSIAAMANAKTDVASPLAAIALALHAALTGETLNFKCTGIPDDSTASSGGFAAPIRELPKTQLVPAYWDKNSMAATNPFVKFRYRKNGVGSIVLHASLRDDTMVHVELLPTNTKEPPGDALTFPLEDHVNLDSLSKALATQQRVIPTLHYKALPVLLTNMCNTFDLGPVRDSVEGGAETSLPYVDTTIIPPIADGLRNNTPLVAQPRVYDQFESPNIRVFQPDRRRGDFDTDLMPGGMADPFSGGNLMGPNHPAFGQQPHGGGFGMRPRFDPYGPPGGPTDPNNIDPSDPRQQPRRRPPPGGTGDPNPDHQRPPQDLGNNMFM